MKRLTLGRWVNFVSSSDMLRVWLISVKYEDEEVGLSWVNKSQRWSKTRQLSDLVCCTGKLMVNCFILMDFAVKRNIFNVVSHCYLTAGNPEASLDRRNKTKTELKFHKSRNILYKMWDWPTPMIYRYIFSFSCKISLCLVLASSLIRKRSFLTFVCFWNCACNQHFSQIIVTPAVFTRKRAIFVCLFVERWQSALF